MKLLISFLIFLVSSGVAQNTSTSLKTFGVDSAFSSTLDIKKTCRWSNCDSNCEPGFIPVQRQGYKEHLLDDTHCGKHGLSVFCCPQDLPQPLCSWKGHKKSGRCEPGCGKGEVEVGTLGAGCRFRHQTACCSLGPAVEAYGQCMWHGESPICRDKNPHRQSCSKEYPVFMFAASLGFGGDKKCDSGAKSFCCKDQPPEPFHNCRWYEKETRFFPPNMCEPSCPSGNIRLAIHAGNCKRGESAYCCSGPPPPWSPPLPPKEPDIVQKFREAVTTYKDAYKDPSTCPWESRPPLEDWLQEGVFPPQQSQTDESSLAADSPQCSSWKLCLTDLLTIVTLANIAQMNNDQRQLVNVWDSIIPPVFGEGTSVADLWDYIKRYRPSFVPAIVEFFLYDLNAWARYLKNMKKIETDLCHYPGQRQGGTFGVASGNETVWEGPAKFRLRTISPQLDGFEGYPNNVGYPTMARILDGIVHKTDLSLHFARWDWYNAVNNPNSPPGPMLKIYYWIGSTPGQYETGAREAYLDRYRDLRRNRNSQVRDRWVVFHLHFDSTQPVFYSSNGRTFAKIPSISMFHASFISDEQRGRWSVLEGDTGRKGNNNRQVLRCPWPRDPDGNRGTWTAGFDHGNIPTESMYSDMAKWLHSLWSDGYLHYPGFSLIANQLPVRYPFREVDPYGGPVNWKRPTDSPEDRQWVGDDIRSSPYRTSFLFQGGQPGGNPQAVTSFAMPPKAPPPIK